MKKKIISLVLAIILCVSLYSCGSEGQKKYSINETAISKQFECSLEQVSFSESVDVGDFSPRHLLPTTKDTTIFLPAKSGNILLCFTANIKYTGTKTINPLFGSGSDSIGFSATYDKEYTYTSFAASRYENSRWELYRTYENSSITGTTFTPLSNDTLAVRAFIELPAVVAETQDKPLDITINLGKNESVTFNINP